MDSSRFVSLEVRGVASFKPGDSDSAEQRPQKTRWQMSHRVQVGSLVISGKKIWLVPSVDAL